MVSLTQLRAFYQVGKYLNFSIAAEKLFVCQPAVTKQVKLLEEFCNSKLLYKKRGKIYLTAEGEKVFYYASQIFNLEEQLSQMISGLQNLKQGSLRIGTTKTYARYLMPILLKAFQKSFPEVLIELDEGSSLEITKTLLDFKNSLVIVSKVEDHPDISFIPLMSEEILLIAVPGHHLAKRDEINFTDLKREPIIMKERGSGTRKLVEQCARGEKTRLNVVAQTSNMEFIKQYVFQKRAISFVVRSSVESELSQGELISIPIKSHKLLLGVYVAFLSDHEPPPAARAFIDYLRSVSDLDPLPIGIDLFAEKLSAKAGIHPEGAG
ncbi:LysR substrate binding domain protein [delta proteobacterium NaphS2]|nr:LysR substrate binding domain protein [delta proteobacterium NaphS2]